MANHRQKKRLQTVVENWPDDDRRRWTEAIMPRHVLDDAGTASAWRPATKMSVSKGYGRWLATLATAKLLDPSQSAVERATKTNVAAYVLILQAQISAISVSSYVHNLAMALEVMAPETDWQWLWNYSRLLLRGRVPSSRKLGRVVAVSELTTAGYQLMDAADDCVFARTVIQHAISYRDGLMVALLAACLLRLKNFCTLEFGKHLRQYDNIFRICVPAEEMKTWTAYECCLSEDLSFRIQQYKQIYRPSLVAAFGCNRESLRCGPAGNRLWVSSYGCAMPAGCVNLRIVTVTRRYFGHSVNPHLFRDCGATSSALEDPDNLERIAPLLGHRNMIMSERFYNHAHSAAAMQRFQGEVAAFRRQMEKRDKLL